MENASKALLIAGAILLTLAIISLGVMIFGEGKGFVDMMDKKLSQSDIDNHNSQFRRFEGVVSGVEVKNACTAVAQTNQDKKISMKIKVQVNIPTGTEIVEFPKANETQSKAAYNRIMNEISSTQAYIGNITYNSKGVIDTLTFEKK